MTISDHPDEFEGHPVRDFDPQEGVADTSIAYRLRLGWDDYEEGIRILDLLQKILADPRAAELEALIIGDWGQVGSGRQPDDVIDALVSARGRLANLKALFFGDIVMEESEISWIQQGDLSPFWSALPALEVLKIRGATGLTLGRVKHGGLRKLVIESGGLPVAVVRQVTSAELPMLEHLELWLGDPGYGWDGTVADLAPILAGGLFPKLRYLGLRDSAIADEVAMAVASAPILQQLHTLDLSMGNLSDEGARALLDSPTIRSIQRLDVHHHYLSEPTVAALKNLGIEVDASEPREAYEYGGTLHRYIAVSE